jgi:ribonuclease BN (tRNA processing enzyme)
MEIRILGAHNVESVDTRLTTLLVDRVLAVEAGAITSTLSLAEQEDLTSILLTHCHYDHIRDIAAIALNISMFQKTVRVHSQAVTLKAISDHILNGVIYPKFTEIRTPDNPPIEFRSLEPHKPLDIDGYEVLAVPVNHVVPTVGYQVGRRGGDSFFYSGDTGPGLSSCWDSVAPRLLLLDVTLPNRLEEHALSAGHLTPRLLGEELAAFKVKKGYLPPVVIVHLSPVFEPEIAEEVERMAEKLGADVTLGFEGMKLEL